jgi:hypothetical protein
MEEEEEEEWRLQTRNKQELDACWFGEFTENKESFVFVLPKALALHSSIFCSK